MADVDAVHRDGAVADFYKSVAAASISSAFLRQRGRRMQPSRLPWIVRLTRSKRRLSAAIGERHVAIGHFAPQMIDFDRVGRILGNIAFCVESVR